MNGSGPTPLVTPGRKQGSRGISVKPQARRQTGGVGICDCERFETSGEKVRGAGREISQTQTDGRLLLRLEMRRLPDEIDSEASVR